MSREESSFALCEHRITEANAAEHIPFAIQVATYSFMYAEEFASNFLFLLLYYVCCTC